MPHLKRRNVIPDRNWRIMDPIPPEVKTVLELGNKRDSMSDYPYKAWFEQEGYKHVSVDLNGKDGAISADLRLPLRMGMFDLVTNIGTTEHVSEQEPVWRNIAEACRVLFISVTPKPFCYPRHGIWYPTPQFYSEFARLNGFVVERMFEDDRKGRRVNIHVRLRRFEMRPFVMPDASMLVREQETDKYSEFISNAAISATNVPGPGNVESRARTMEG